MITHSVPRGIRKHVGLIAITAFSVGASPAHAQQVAPALSIPRLTTTIRLDGVVDPAEWNGVAIHEPTMLQPVFEGTSARKTEMMIAHDGRSLYVAARLHGRDIRGNSLQRDRYGSDDSFRLVLDTFDDNENGVGFATTPTGVRIDFAIASDGQSVNYDWNSAWDVATTQSDTSWFVEMRIPFSSLRFETHEGRATMGVIMVRTTAVFNEIFTYPGISPRFSGAIQRVSSGQQIELDSVSTPRDLRILPYALGGGSRTVVRSPGAPDWSYRGSSVSELGGDIKWGITSNLTLDITTNTDFAQAEVDDQQVNLSRFNLFFPEKRQFFLERAGVFDFSMGGIGDASRIFHSRQIGLTEQGQPIRLLGGARLVGRAGGWDIAALDLQTEGAALRAAENFGVLRLRRQVLNRGSTVGGILTSRMSEGGSRNHVIGTDALLRIHSNDFLTLQAAETIDDERPTRGLQASSFRALWERRASQGLVYRFGAKWTGPDHDPELGFLPRRDFSYYETNIRYGWFPGERTSIQNIQPSLLMYAFRRNRDGVVESAQATGFLNFQFKSGVFGNINQSRTIEEFSQGLQLAPGVTVPAGKHSFLMHQFFVSTSPGGRLRSGFSGGYGSIYDGRRITAGLSPSVTLSRNIELGADYQLNRITFAQRQQSLNADIARLRVQAALDTRWSASGFIQYNNAARLFVSNVRFRMHLNEGRDLFIVYNEQLNTEHALHGVAVPRLLDRTLLVKMVYGFSP